MDFLKKLGYIPLINPVNDVNVLDILFKSSKGTVTPFNTNLSDLLKSNENSIPLINTNLAISSILNASEKIHFDLHTSLLFFKKVFNFLKNYAKNEIMLEQNNLLNIEIHNAKKDNINLFSLARFIESSFLNEVPLSIQEQIFNDEIFVVTEVIKSNKFSIKKDNNSQSKISINGETDPLSVNIDMNKSGTKTNGIEYYGEEYLSLGVKAYKIFCNYSEYNSKMNNFRIEISKNITIFKEDDFPGKN